MVFSYNDFEKQRRLRLVPKELQISTIIFANEESWGFGPGAAETGLIVYELPDNIATAIQKKGMSYFTKIEQQANNGYGECSWCGIYEPWSQTPIKERDTLQPKKITDFLNNFDGSFSTDSEIDAELNDAISKSGSYFAHGRSSTLIIMPNIKKVAFVYAG